MSDVDEVVESYEIPETPGGLLAAARVRAGLSLEQVANRSRVPAEALAAIDADDFDALPAMVYLRGFIRLYAQEVGLDPEAPIARLDALVAAHEATEEEAHEAGEDRARERTKTRLRARAGYSIALGALVAVILLTLLSLAPGPLEAREPADASPPVTAPEAPEP
jgi:cytoskeletal protein RodZ